MNEELREAVIAIIRASSVGAGVGGRIYKADQVPPTTIINGVSSPTPFPRCYVALRRSPNYVQYNRADQGIDRIQLFEVLFAQTTAASPTADKDIEGWDKATKALLHYGVSCTNLIFARRIGDSPATQQSDDLNSYLVGGGMYEAHFQEG
jgi:hypothetical protein